MKAREEREKQYIEEEKYAPVGSPEDVMRSHSTNLYSSLPGPSRGRMQKV
jgi:hypothetical protein